MTARECKSGNLVARSQAAYQRAAVDIVADRAFRPCVSAFLTNALHHACALLTKQCAACACDADPVAVKPFSEHLTTLTDSSSAIRQVGALRSLPMRSSDFVGGAHGLAPQCCAGIANCGRQLEIGRQWLHVRSYDPRGPTSCTIIASPGRGVLNRSRGHALRPGV